MPVQVSGLSDVTAISGGSNHSLALKNNGTVWAWGWNSHGELGDGTTTTSRTPVQVQGQNGVGFFNVYESNPTATYTVTLNANGGNVSPASINLILCPV